MATMIQTRRVYSADELHRLRSACSQPKLKESIEERDGDDADLVKEHVLRGSRSFAARSWKSRTSAIPAIRAVSNKENRRALASETEAPFAPPHNDEAPVATMRDVVMQQPLYFPINNFGRRSPTPSLKRQKIENLVKAHGSPTHVRVTAGGRIVPSSQSPLCHPRFGYSAIKVNGGLIKFAPTRNLGKATEWSNATEDGFIAQDASGRMCQIVNGIIMPLHEFNGALQLYMDAPNLDIQRGSPVDAPVRHSVQSHQAFNLSPHAQLNALELDYAKLDHRLKEVDKTEVLHGRSMVKSAKDALVASRRELVTSMDKIRKAIKNLKEQGITGEDSKLLTHPTKAPSVSSHAYRPVSFLHARNNPVEQPALPQPSYNHFYTGPYAGHTGFPSVPTVESGITGQPWPMPAQGIMMLPAPFDGSVTVGPMPLPGPATERTGTLHSAGVPSPPSEKSQRDQSQMEGAKLPSSSRSHAIPIKLPHTKPNVTAKSTLNPMSPAYKPVSDDGRDSGSYSGEYHCEAQMPTSDEIRSQLFDDTIPGGKTARMHSSSMSSFETADFFPRNTREYSTRQYIYPAPISSADGKENQGLECVEPMSVTKGQDADGKCSQATMKSPEIVVPQDGGYRAPTAPPGTPTDSTASAGKHVHLAIGSAEMKKINSANLEFESVPGRQKHNISPKAKRQDWQFVEEDPSQAPSEPFSSVDRFHHCNAELCVTSSPPEVLDFSNESRDWIEGYQSGLNRRPVGADRSGEFLDGYCSGLLRSKPAAPSTDSPTRNSSRQPSPSTETNHNMGNDPGTRRPRPPPLVLTPIESTQQSIDTLKQAILAPTNEAAVLTPAVDGLHVDEARFNLGAWAKQHASQNSYGFPAEAIKDQRQPAGKSTDDAYHNGIQISVIKDFVTSGDRVGSMSSIDTGLHRQMPGFRVFSPHLDWKSASSVARQAGFANGSFAGGQLDGAFLAQRAEMPAPAAAKPRRHFHEESLDEIDSPSHLARVTSLPVSPRSSPVKDNSRKSPSPAKAKFESIAGKVGTKTGKDHPEPTSPPGKRRWRDVWRGGRKEEGSPYDMA